MTDADSTRPANTTAFVPAARPPCDLAQVRLSGDVERPLTCTVAELRDLPQHVVAAEFACACQGQRRQTFTGPLLFDLVSASGPRFDPVIAKDRLRFVVVVTGADGHVVVLSWGEIDPSYGHSEVLVATSTDGRPLDADGPQLAVPGDLGGGRYVSGITTIWTGSADRFGRER